MPKIKQKEINDLRDIMRKKIEEICESEDEEDGDKNKQSSKESHKTYPLNRQVTSIGFLSKYT